MDLTISQISEKARLVMAYKTADELIPGDFLYLSCSGLKNDGGIPDSMYYLSKYSKPDEDGYSNHACLCEVEKVVFTTDKKMMAEDFVPGQGGTRVYDVPENFNPTSADVQRYRDHAVQLVTLVYAEDTGRYFFTDRQGYDYNRYIYVAKGFKKMFRPEIRRYRRRRQWYEEQARLQHINQCRFAGKLAEKRLARDFSYLNPQKSLKWNLTAIFKHYGIEVQVKQWSKPRYYDNPVFDINYTREEDRGFIAEVISVLTGRWNHWEKLQHATDLSPKGYCWHESRDGNSYSDHIYHNCFAEKFGQWQYLQVGFLVRKGATA